MASTIAREVLRARSILITLCAWFPGIHRLWCLGLPGAESLRSFSSTAQKFDACESRSIFKQGTMNLGNLGSSARIIMTGDGALSFSSSR